MNISLNNLIAIHDKKYEVSFLGRLLWFSIPELKVSLDELQSLFQKNLIDEKYLPNPISPRDAFRRATKMAELKRVNLDQECYFNLLVRPVAEDSEKITRHIVREIVDSKNVRLSYQPIVTLIHTMDKNNIDSFDYQTHDVLHPAEQEALNKALAGYVECKEKYNAQNIRTLIMAILSTCSPVAVRPSGGVYFSPESYSFDIQNLQNLVLDLGQYCLDSNDKTDFRTVPVIDVGDQRDMINKSLQEEIKNDSFSLINEISEILKSGRKVYQNTAIGYIDKVHDLKAKVKEYEALLETEVCNVQSNMELALEAAKKLLDTTSVGK